MVFPHFSSAPIPQVCKLRSLPILARAVTIELDFAATTPSLKAEKVEVAEPTSLMGRYGWKSSGAEKDQEALLMFQKQDVVLKVI